VMPVPKPTSKIKRALSELHDLPAEAEQEIRDLTEAKQRITALKRELTMVKRVQPAPDVKDVEIQVTKAVVAAEDRLHRHYQNLLKRFNEVANSVRRVTAGAADAMEILQEMDSAFSMRRLETYEPIPYQERKAEALESMARSTAQEINRVVNEEAENPIGGGLGRMLAALVRAHPEPLSTSQVATLSRLKASGGTFKTYLSRLKTQGYAERTNGDQWVATLDGFTAVGGKPPQQTPEELIEMWKASIGGTPAKMLDLLVQYHSHKYLVTLDQLADELGMTASGGTFKTYVSRLRSNGLATTEGNIITASEDLFR